jgi:1,4-alpha-glucan branching enzyme
MNDTLRYMARPHFFRRWHGDDIRFSAVYAFNENFVLPLSHDEVVYGKRSLLEKQPGDDWQRFAGLRLLYGYMWAHPGKKLLFMGGEFAQNEEWHHERPLDWHQWAQPLHAGVARWIVDLNSAMRRLPALHAGDFDGRGFRWLPIESGDPNILAFLRRGRPGDAQVIALCNMTPQPHHSLRVGVPHGGDWYELLNSDAAYYGGSGWGNLGRAHAVDQPLGDQPASLALTLPPLAMLLLADRPFDHHPPSPGVHHARP